MSWVFIFGWPCTGGISFFGGIFIIFEVKTFSTSGSYNTLRELLFVSFWVCLISYGLNQKTNFRISALTDMWCLFACLCDLFNLVAQVLSLAMASRREAVVQFRRCRLTRHHKVWFLLWVLCSRCHEFDSTFESFWAKGFNPDLVHVHFALASRCPWAELFGFWSKDFLSRWFRKMRWNPLAWQLFGSSLVFRFALISVLEFI